VGGLAGDQAPPQTLLDEVVQADLIFCSTLRRSIETAEAVAQGRAIIPDSVFDEAPLPPPAIPGKHPPPLWGVWARISWWLGFNQDMESRRQAELRAHAAVATLTARALRGERVVLLAHGWFNRMMRPVLHAQGWRCVEDGGDGYWAFRRFEHRAAKFPQSARFKAPSHEEEAVSS
jgi:broad specificity phosphatase PhoE